MKLTIKQFGFGASDVRAFVDDAGETWFVAADVAIALGYERARDAVAQHCKGAVKRRIPTPGGAQQAVCIPERDMYRLVMRSRLPAAEAFEEWVVGTVLPSIRKTGQFQADTRKLRHATASSTKVQDAMLAQVREAIGKATQAHHFSNEHRMVNSLLLGEFKGIDRDTLTPGQLDLLAHLELRNAVLIGAGMSYEQRKGALKAFALDWRMAQPLALAEPTAQEVAHD